MDAAKETEAHAIKSLSTTGLSLQRNYPSKLAIVSIQKQLSAVT